ncbi:adenylyl-sulfate kinase [Urechidicola sp. KH5]
MNENLFLSKFEVTRKAKNNLNNHASFVVWFTGLSGSGKSTIANEVEKVLFDLGIRSALLDGDNIRIGINKDLCFTNEDREENLRRVAEVSKLFVDAGVVVLAAFVSPTELIRTEVKNIIGKDDVVEVYINTDLNICKERDVKGLYAKAAKGEIKNFTGISAPFEPPVNPDLEICTEKNTIKDAAMEIVTFLKPKLKKYD